MDILQSLAAGFAGALTPVNLMFAFAGVALGTAVGVLPGIGPLGAMSMLLSLTYGMPPDRALILFAAIYYGAQYGGSTTSILVNVPGETSSVVTCIDGHRMAQQGRAGAALAVAAIGSFVAGTLSVVGLMLLAPPLANLALKFGPPEYFNLMLAGLLVLVFMSSGSKLKALLMVLLGLALATVGTDYLGIARYTFGIPKLFGGLDMVAVIMGMFGLVEMMNALARADESPPVKSVRMRELLPTRDEARRSVGPIARGSVLGFLMGLLPGPVVTMSTFASYALEKKLSRHPERFGRGAIEGVAGPEAANNAAAGGAFLPLVALGVPFSGSTALILGALLLAGVTPGPNFIQEQPALFWTAVASMYIGNVMLVILNLPLVGVFVSLLKAPPRLLIPLVLALCLIGAYAVNNSLFDVWVLIGAGLVGYLLSRYGFDLAPLVIARVLGTQMEIAFGTSLALSSGDPAIFVTRPIAATIAAVVLAVAAWSLFAAWRAGRRRPPALPES